MLHNWGETLRDPTSGGFVAGPSDQILSHLTFRGVGSGGEVNGMYVVNESHFRVEEHRDI